MEVQAKNKKKPVAAVERDDSWCSHVQSVGGGGGGEFEFYEKAEWKVINERGQPICLCGDEMKLGQWGSLLCSTMVGGCGLQVNYTGLRFFFPVRKGWQSLMKKYALCMPVCTRQYELKKRAMEDDDSDLKGDAKKMATLKRARMIKEISKIEEDGHDIKKCPKGRIAVTFGKQEKNFGEVYVSCTSCRNDQSPSMMALSTIAANRDVFRAIYAFDYDEEEMSVKTYDLWSDAVTCETEFDKESGGKRKKGVVKAGDGGEKKGKIKAFVLPTVATGAKAAGVVQKMQQQAAPSRRKKKPEFIDDEAEESQLPEDEIELDEEEEDEEEGEVEEEEEEEEDLPPPTSAKKSKKKHFSFK